MIIYFLSFIIYTMVKKTRARRARRGRGNVRHRQRRGLGTGGLLTVNQPGHIYGFKRFTTPSQMVAAEFQTAYTANTAAAISYTTGFLTYNLGTGATAGSASYASFALAFSLSDVPNSTEFTYLFDMFRIKGIQVKLYPILQAGLSSTSGILGAADGYVECVVHSVIDHDDVIPFTASEAGVLEMMERPGYKIHGVGLPSKPIFSRTWAPVHLAIVENAAAAATARATAPRKQWLDCAYPGALHYGLKFIIEAHHGAYTLNMALQYRMVIAFNLEFKDVR